MQIEICNEKAKSKQHPIWKANKQQIANGIRFTQGESKAKADWQIKRALDKISAIKQAHNQVASDGQGQRLNNPSTGR